MFSGFEERPRGTYSISHNFKNVFFYGQINQLYEVEVAVKVDCASARLSRSRFYYIHRGT